MIDLEKRNIKGIVKKFFDPNGFRSSNNKVNLRERKSSELANTLKNVKPFLKDIIHYYFYEKVVLALER